MLTLFREGMCLLTEHLAGSCPTMRCRRSSPPRSGPRSAARGPLRRSGSSRSVPLRWAGHPIRLSQPSPTCGFRRPAPLHHLAGRYPKPSLNAPSANANPSCFSNNSARNPDHARLPVPKVQLQQPRTRMRRGSHQHPRHRRHTRLQATHRPFPPRHPDCVGGLPANRARRTDV
jgi:hypothetical protein